MEAATVGHTTIINTSNPARATIKMICTSDPSNSNCPTTSVTPRPLLVSICAVMRVLLAAVNSWPVACLMIHGENSSPAVMRVPTAAAPVPVTSTSLASILNASTPSAGRELIAIRPIATKMPSTAMDAVSGANQECIKSSVVGLDVPNTPPCSKLGEGIFNQNVPTVCNRFSTLSAIDATNRSIALSATFPAALPAAFLTRSRPRRPQRHRVEHSSSQWAVEKYPPPAHAPPHAM